MRNNRIETIALELASSCNLSCSYCDNQYRQSKKSERALEFMPVDMIDFIISETMEFEVKPSITLSYEGESTLHPNFELILEKFHSNNFNTWLSTNAVNTSLSLLKLLEKKCSHTCISVHNYSSFEKISLLLKKSDFKNISLSWILDSFDSHSINRWYREFGSALDLSVPIYFWLKARYSSQKIEIMDKKPFEVHLKSRKPCMAPFNYLAILSDGKISPCCITSRYTLKGVDIYDGFENVVNSDEYLYYLNQHKELKLEEYGTCLNCEFWLEGWLGDQEVTLFDRQCLMQGLSIFIDNKK